MKLLELAVENLRGVPDGAYSFAEADGSARDVVVLAPTIVARWRLTHARAPLR